MWLCGIEIWVLFRSNLALGLLHSAASAAGMGALCAALLGLLDRRLLSFGARGCLGHRVCRACRAVIDVPCAEDARPHPELPAGIAGVVDDAQVIYRGLCEPCVREQRAIHSTFRID